MSGQLHLRLDKWLDGDSLERGVVANVYAVPPAGQPAISTRDRRDLLIPSGQERPQVVDVEPGRYLVEALLPSGDIITSEVTVAEAEQVDVTLRAEDSPHEWLSWQHLMGNVADRPAHLTADKFPAFSIPFVHWLTNPVEELQGDEATGAKAWSLLADLIDSPWTARTKATNSPMPIGPFSDDEQYHLYQLYQLTSEGPLLPTRSLGHRGSPTPRRYLLVETEHASEFVCVPVPWTHVSSGQEVVVQVLVRKQAARGEPITALTLRDTALGTALGYMTLGALPTAEMLFDQAREMLFYKQSNPLAAAAGGYVLLATERGAVPKEWHQWIENLHNWSDWLPDGAIQYGSLKLRHQRSAADVEDARNALVTAYRRGLPFYSVGIQWLLDGLTLLAEDDKAIAQMAEAVRRVAWRCNMQEPFTILRLRRG